MTEEEPDNRQSQPTQEDRDSIWSIPLGRRALYFGLFTIHSLAGIGFLIWYEVSENTADTWQQTVLSITQGIGVATVGAAGLALLMIEGPTSFMVVADYLRKRLIEPLEEKRRIEAERLQAAARAEGRAEGRTEGRAEGRTEGRAEGHAEWVAWNERRMAAEAKGETFDEPPPGLPAEPKQDDAGQPPGTPPAEGE